MVRASKFPCNDKLNPEIDLQVRCSRAKPYIHHHPSPSRHPQVDVHPASVEREQSLRLVVAVVVYVFALDRRCVKFYRRCQIKFSTSLGGFLYVPRQNSTKLSRTVLPPWPKPSCSSLLWFWAQLSQKTMTLRSLENLREYNYNIMYQSSEARVRRLSRHSRMDRARIWRHRHFPSPPRVCEPMLHPKACRLFVRDVDLPWTLKAVLRIMRPREVT